MKVNVCNVLVDQFDFDEVVEAIVQHALSGAKPSYVIPHNTQCVVLLQKDAHFREICKDAFLVVPDGVPLLWAASFLRTPLRGRVNGTDLFEHLCAIAGERGLKIFFLGGRPGSAVNAAKILCARYSDLDIVGTYCPPYGFESDTAELAKINETIKAAAPHILFVGLGAPKQEYWIYANHQETGVPISIAVGGSFELVAGVVKRAPKWMQKLGLEWFYRLLKEPRRLWQRYLVCNTLFIWLVLKQRLGLLRSEQSSS
jgi:N-acetylglucosaminyldiphosphoundecaprenol N-acetyl-beta-D-mannosaminyltransferase